MGIGNETMSLKRSTSDISPLSLSIDPNAHTHTHYILHTRKREEGGLYPLRGCLLS